LEQEKGNRVLAENLHPTGINYLNRLRSFIPMDSPFTAGLFFCKAFFGYQTAFEPIGFEGSQGEPGRRFSADRIR